MIVPWLKTVPRLRWIKREREAWSGDGATCTHMARHLFNLWAVRFRTCHVQSLRADYWFDNKGINWRMVNRKNFFCSWIDNLGEMKNGGTNKLEFYDYSFNTGKRFFFSNLGCERDFCKINFFFLFFYFE